MKGWEKDALVGRRLGLLQATCGKSKRISRRRLFYLLPNLINICFIVMCLCNENQNEFRREKVILFTSKFDKYMFYCYVFM